MILVLALVGGFSLGLLAVTALEHLAPAESVHAVQSGPMVPPVEPERRPPAIVVSPPAVEPQAAPPPQTVPPPAEPPPQSAALPLEAAPPDTETPASPPPVVSPLVPLPLPEAVPAWRRYAAVAPHHADRPMIAVVIDDMGVDTRRSAEVMALPAPLTLSFLPYARDLPRQTRIARDSGHELMVHVSMQPQDTAIDAGPNALSSDLTAVEIKRRLDWALGAFVGYVGINNHMGSRFTTDRAGMTVVMEELKARGLLFLDSRTVAHSVGGSIAAAYGVPHVGRNVFLDNTLTEEHVMRQLAEAERIARQAGAAIAIGHPHDATVAALKAWLPHVREKGIALVPVSAVVQQREVRRAAAHTAPSEATRE